LKVPAPTTYLWRNLLETKGQVPQPTHPQGPSLKVERKMWKVLTVKWLASLTTEFKQLNNIFDHNSKSLNTIAQNGTILAQLAIMNTRIEGLDDEKKQYFRLKRTKIIKLFWEEASD
jgi:hypothetical protein